MDPDKILTDYGAEFINKKFKKYCKSKDIILIHGRFRHPKLRVQSKDIIA